MMKKGFKCKMMKVDYDFENVVCLGGICNCIL